MVYVDFTLSSEGMGGASGCHSLRKSTREGMRVVGETEPNVWKV